MKVNKAERATIYFGLVEYQKNLEASVKEHQEHSGEEGYNDENLKFLSGELFNVLSLKERLEDVWGKF